MILYVNDITDSAGLANLPETIYYNLDLLGKELITDINLSLPFENELSYYKSLGRYTCIITLSADEIKMSIVFVDFRKDENEAVKFEKLLTGENGIMKAFNDGLAYYDLAYDLITLELWENRPASLR